MGACGVAVDSLHAPRPRNGKCARAARLVLHQSNATQSKTRGTEAGTPRWTDRNHERRYHTHKLTKRRGGARGLASRGTRPAVLGNNVRWTMAVFYALEIKSLRWATSCHSNWTTTTRKWGRAPIWELLDAHRDRNGAVRGHTALGQQRRETVAPSLTNVDHSIFFVFCLFSLLELFIT